MKKYKIELTEKQLRSISEACEYYSRICAGQLELPSGIQEYMYKKYEFDEYIKRRNESNEILKNVKEKCFDMSSGQCLGIGNDKLVEVSKILYDVYRPILEQLTKESDDTNYSVYSYPGLSYSKEGRINVEKI